MFTLEQESLPIRTSSISPSTTDWEHSVSNWTVGTPDYPMCLNESKLKFNVRIPADRNMKHIICISMYKLNVTHYLYLNYKYFKRHKLIRDSYTTSSDNGMPRIIKTVMLVNVNEVV